MGLINLNFDNMESVWILEGMEFKFKILSSIFVILILNACATAPKSKPEQVQTKAPVFLFKTAQWVSTAKVKNFENGGMNHLDIDVMGIRSDQVRMEVAGAFGTPLASVVITSTEFRCASHQNKKFYFGKNRMGVLGPLADLPLDPRDLAKFIFDEVPVSHGWKCYIGQDQMLSRCDFESKQIQVKWTERDKLSRRLLITAPHFEMSWYFNQPQTNVQIKPIAFELNPPASYSKVQL